MFPAGLHWGNPVTVSIYVEMCVNRLYVCCRGQLQGYIEEILSRFGDLLVLNTPDNGLQRLLSNEDQLFVYETAGSLIVTSNFSPEVKSCRTIQ